MPSFPTGFPNAALVDTHTGLPTTAWRLFLVALYERTGAGAGGSLAALQAEITAETAARQAADIVLSGAVTAEAAARTAAVGAETTRAEAAEASLAAEIVVLRSNGALLARQWFMTP